jgi:acyl carrier protein
VRLPRSMPATDIVLWGDFQNERAAMRKVGGRKAGNIDRLLEIIAQEGLVEESKLEPNARLEEIGISADDLVLIGNAIEREFDCDILGDDALDQCRTVAELLALIGRRLSSGAGKA